MRKVLLTDDVIHLALLTFVTYIYALLYICTYMAHACTYVMAPHQAAMEVQLQVSFHSFSLSIFYISTYMRVLYVHMCNVKEPYSKKNKKMAEIISMYVLEQLYFGLSFSFLENQFIGCLFTYFYNFDTKRRIEKYPNLLILEYNFEK